MMQDKISVQKLQSQAWEFLRAKRYSEAIELYSQCYEESSKPNFLYQRGMVHLEAGDYAPALEDMKGVIAFTDPKYLADGYFIYKGICHWYLGQYSEVLPTWKMGLNTPYTDASGGVVLAALMLYGAERLDDQAHRKLALRLLRKHGKRQLNYWPGVIVPFLLDQIDEATLLSAASQTTSEIVHSRHQCQADFHIALHHLLEKNWPQFEASLQKCAASPYGYHEAEYFLARWELSQNFPRSISERVN